MSSSYKESEKKTSNKKFQKIHRHNYEREFTVMPNHIVECEELSWGAKALLWYLLSRPKDWEVYRSQLSSVYKGKRKRGNGKESVDSFFKELIELKYIIYTARDEETGKFIHRYDVYPEPVDDHEPNKSSDEKSDKNSPLPRENSKKDSRAGLTPNGFKYPQQRNDSIQKNNTTTDPEGTRSSDSPHKKEKVVVVFDCLKKLKLPDKTRKRLSRKFSEQHLNLAVERTLRWTSRRNDEAALMTVLSRMDEWNDDSDESKKQENQESLDKIRHLDGKKIKGINVIIGSNYAEFSQGSTSCYTMIEDDDFEENISKYLNLFKEPL